MLLRSIPTISLPAWLAENRKLRALVLFAAALCAANLLCYALVLAPATARLGRSEMKYAELRKRQAVAFLFRQQQQDFAGIKAGIPTQKDMPLLVKELAQAARQLNLKVGPINYDIPRADTSELAMLTFSFSAEGRYPEVKRFIHELEASSRFIGIKELKLDADKGAVKLQVKLVTYIKTL